MCSVFLLRNRLLVTTVARLADGFWREVGSVSVTPLIALDPAELGAVVFWHVNRSRAGLPDAERHAARVRPVLVAAGLSANAEFVAAARHVSVERDEHVVTVVPGARGSGNGDYEGLPGKARRLVAPAGIELGVAVRDAFTDAT